MPCSGCRGTGHNIRTCPVVKKVAGHVRDYAIEEAADYIAGELGEAALAEIIELGLDMTLPGAGTLIKAARLAYKIAQSKKGKRK